MSSISNRYQRSSRLLEGALAQARPQAEAKGLTLAAEPCGAAARFDRKWTA